MPRDVARIAILCEDHAHRALVTCLADRVVLDEAAKRSVDWIDETTLPYHRRFMGREDRDDLPEHQRFYTRADAMRDAEDLPNQPLVGGRPVKLRGHIDGQPLAPEASFWRRVFLLFAVMDGPPDLLVVARDTDGDEDNLRGLKQALPLAPLPVIVATPHQDAEAWFVAGFAPASGRERVRLTELHMELGFSPPDEPHRLTAHPNHAPTDAKRVLRLLLHGENKSRPPALEELHDLCERTLRDLALLERRGVHCKLVAFLKALREGLVPLVLPGK
jgi:hypothetical protein